LPGAVLRLRGTGLSAVADSAGAFHFAVRAGRYVLLAGYTGFGGDTSLVSAPGSVVLRLRVSAVLLQGVTVSTGYQELPLARATGSFAVVGRALLERAVGTDVLERLRDVVPGLTFNAVGTAVSIRGQSTLFSNAEPLVVVDGFPYNEPLASLNPADVSSVTVLKDAAAASIWGSRAGNGVIVVTTKRGEYGQPLQVSLGSSLQWVARADLFYQRAMSSADYIGLERRLFAEGYFSAQEQADGHLPLSPAVELLAAQRDGLLDAAAVSRGLAALSAQDLRRDVMRYLERTGLNQQYALGLSGGSAGQRYRFSAGLDRGADNLAGNGSQRVTLSGGNDWRLLGQRLELSAGMYVSENSTERDNPGPLGWNNGQALYPYARLADAGGGALAVTKDHRVSFLSESQQLGLADWRYRPLEELRLADNGSRLSVLRLDGSARYRLLPGLSAELRYQFEQGLASGRNLHAAGSYYSRDLYNRFSQPDGAGGFSHPLPAGGILDLDDSRSLSNDLRGQLAYGRTLGAGELSLLAGYERRSQRLLDVQSRVYGYDAAHGTGLPVDGASVFSYYDNPAGGSAIPYGGAEAGAVDHELSWYANAGFRWKSRFLLSASARLDRSNLFGVRTNQKGAPLWSAGLGWELSREGFYRLGLLPYLRLRASYGYNGNVNKTLSAFTTAAYFDGSQSPSQLPYAAIVNPPDPALRWERIGQWNLGLDFSSRDNRLSGTLEYFEKRGLDLIGSTAFAPSTGITVFTGNAAQTRGRGADVSLESRNLAGRLRWGTVLLLSWVSDRVTRYDAAGDALSYLQSGALGAFPLPGRPLYAVYSYRWAGLDARTGDPQGYLDGKVSRDYGAILAAATPRNLVYNGPSRPVVSGALRNTLGWRGLSLSANISYAFGYYFRRNALRYGSDGGLSGQSGDYALRWQRPGDELRTQVPSAPALPDGQRDQFYAYSSALVDRGDHIRLRDVNLSYTFRAGALRWLPRQALQLYVYAANLGILWRANRDGQDPDFANTYPAPRTLALGAHLNF
jgi:TonB-linked SusC/RagA family outer membrane protein